MFALVIEFEDGGSNTVYSDTRAEGEGGFSFAVEEGLTVNMTMKTVALWETTGEGSAETLLHSWTMPEYSPTLALIDD